MNTIKFDFENLFSGSVGEKYGLSRAEVEGFADKVRAAHERLAQTRSRGEIGFYDLPSDTENVDRILDTAKRICSRFENILVLGIGGSALGMKCLANALLPPYFNMLPARGRRGFAKLFVCDNIDPDGFEPIFELLDWKQTCVCVISKSGRTTETMAQFFLVKEILIKKFGREKWREHVVIITDPNTGPLRSIAKEEGINSFSVPVNVGGRFSVLSSVGLFPAACVGIDIKNLLAGAVDVLAHCSQPDLNSNPVYMNAVVHYLFDTVKNIRVSVMMPYADGLEKFSDWYAQLFAESLGKEGKGPTPVKALGVTDQHSQLQLYMEGPFDKLITLVTVEEFGKESRLPGNLSEPFEYLSNHSLSEILDAERKGTSGALKEAHRPHLTVTLKKLDEYNVGGLLMAYQIQIAFMGILYGINPFNQPGVELSKKITKEILTRS